MSMTTAKVNTVSVFRSKRGTVAVTTGAPGLAMSTIAESRAAELSADVAINVVCPAREPIAVDPEIEAAELERDARMIVAPSITVPCGSRATTLGVKLAPESTTYWRLEKRTAETGIRVTVVNETTVARPETVAVAVLVTPTVLPRVHFAAARPFPSVSVVVGETEPLPALAANVTVAPPTGLPYLSRTLTISESILAPAGPVQGSMPSLVLLGGAPGSGGRLSRSRTECSPPPLIQGSTRSRSLFRRNWS